MASAAALPSATGRAARAHICYVVSSEGTAAAFLRDHIEKAAARYEVTVVANSSTPAMLAQLGLPAELCAVRIERKIRPIHDLRALVKLYRLFRRRRFALVHSVTPKAGLLAMAAGWLARVPVRIHTFTGQVWATRDGPARQLLKLMDRLTAQLATRVLVDSPSQREFLISQHVVSAAKSLVLRNGSISGVDLERFKPAPATRANLRCRLGYDDGDVVFLYVGRINRDKGVLDLAAAFAEVATSTTRARLLIVGPDEEGTRAVVQSSLSALATQAQFIDYTDRPEDYMAAADVFCLPSYREGFGSTIIEAAACGVPAIASRIYGVTDAVADGKSGLLYPAGDIPALVSAMTRLIADSELRQALGDAARVRAAADFPMAELTAALLAFYETVLN